MTISTAYTPDTYAGDASTTSFAITFAFLSDGDNIKVTLKTDSTGALAVQTNPTHYSVSGSNVVFVSAPASGETVIIELDPDYKQESDYTENSNFPAETLETDLDQLKLEVQLAKDQADRAIRFDSAVDISSFTATIPATTADKFIKINSAGTGFELGTGDSILDSLAKTDGNIIVGDGTNFVVESGATARTSIGAIATTVEDTTPQLGGDLDLNSNSIGVVGALTPVLGTALTLSNGATGPGGIRFLEDTDNGTNYIGIKAPSAITTTVDFELPDGDGSSGQVIKTDGSATLSWGTVILGVDATANETSVSLSSGTATVGIADNPTVPGTGAMIAPSGTTAQRPGSPSSGQLRFNSTTSNYEYYDGSSWEAFATGGGIADVVDDTTPQLGGDLDLNGNNIDFPTTANISDCLDEDDMSTNSATALATQQSIKAYVDSGTTTLTNKTIDANSNTITDLPYDIAFTAGFDSSSVKEDAAVQTYAEMVMARSGEIVGESGYADTAPTGAALILDIEKNGTTVYSTKPQFAATAQTLTAGTLKTDGTEDFVAGDRITFKVTQVGSTEPGEGIRFTLKGEV